MRIGIFSTFRNTVVPFNGQMYKTTLTCIRFTNLISALSNNLKILGFNYFSQITYLITLFEVTMKKYHSDTVWQKSVQNMHVETSNANCYCLLLKDIHHWNNIFKQELSKSGKLLLSWCNILTVMFDLQRQKSIKLEYWLETKFHADCFFLCH